MGGAGNRTTMFSWPAIARSWVWTSELIALASLISTKVMVCDGLALDFGHPGHVNK